MCDAMPLYIELLEQLRAEFERLESGQECRRLQILGACARPVTLPKPPHDDGHFGNCGVSRSRSSLLSPELRQDYEVPTASTSAYEPAEEETPLSNKVNAAVEASVKQVVAPSVDIDDEEEVRKNRSSRISKAASSFLETDEDLEMQYNLMVAKTKKERSFSIPVGCFGITADDVEDRLECINRSRLPFRHSFLGRIAESKAFHSLVSTLIISNVIFIIVETDVTLKHSFKDTQANASQPPGTALFKAVDTFFTWAFALELLLRILVEELAFLFGSNWRWNYFDSSLVASSIAESALDGMGIDATFARVLRVLRMSRALRIIRMFQAFRELRVLLDSIFHILLPLAWSVLTLSLVIIMFSLVIMNAVNSYLELDSHDDVVRRQLMEYYSSASTTFLSLFMALTNGQSWYYMMMPLQAISNVYVIVFILFILLLQLGVLNIITSVFVGNAALFAQKDLDMIQLAEADQHAYTMSKLNDVFAILDKDGNGGISLDEFEQWTRMEKVRAFFERVLGLEAWKVGRFFRMLDMNGDEIIDKHEFVVGCMRLRGSAKNMDQEVLNHLAKTIKTDMKSIKATLHKMNSTNL
eukprot:TRINITY_DN56381_c0_g1_i1.p1 TRINITY_DN56381_c0_g1~~TRINITY_DN56381_c0_g1_i1.p1  ORF type:complete len:584 (-),score=91.40 TRINITY_DN56381_c0_g1_i1:322-2073(-)